MTRPHAHRNEPEQLRPRDVVLFAVGMAMIVVLLVLALAAGPVPG